jgi:hypothetical protein
VSEPIKKIKKTPESYSPKGRPEILNMMEQSKKSKQHEHLTENVLQVSHTWDMVTRRPSAISDRLCV